MLAASAQAAGVAMVTDLQGKAVASIAGRSADLTILADIEPGTKVELAAGATLVALYLESGDEYVFKGPAAIEFRPGQPQVLTGAAAGATQPGAGEGREADPDQARRHDPGRDRHAGNPSRSAHPAREPQPHAYAR